MSKFEFKNFTKAANLSLEDLKTSLIQKKEQLQRLSLEAMSKEDDRYIVAMEKQVQTEISELEKKIKENNNIIYDKKETNK